MARNGWYAIYNIPSITSWNRFDFLLTGYNIVIHSMQRTRNLKHLILLSKNLSRDRPPRKNLRQTVLDGIQSQQNSRDERFQSCFSSFRSSNGEETLRISGFSNPYAFKNCSLNCVFMWRYNKKTYILVNGRKWTIVACLNHSVLKKQFLWIRLWHRQHFSRQIQMHLDFKKLLYAVQCNFADLNTYGMKHT